MPRLLNKTLCRDSLCTVLFFPLLPGAARRAAIFLRRLPMPTPDPGLPQVIDGYHGLLKWLIPLPDKFPRNRRFALGVARHLPEALLPRQSTVGGPRFPNRRLAEVAGGRPGMKRSGRNRDRAARHAVMDAPGCQASRGLAAGRAQEPIDYR